MVVDRDVVYGTHERHRLDVFSPSSRSTGRCPAIIYVHGGGFVSGNKHVPETPFYDSIAAWAASIGTLGITLNYRLAPDHPWLAGAEDIARAIAFLRDEANPYANRVIAARAAGEEAGETMSFIDMEANLARYDLSTGECDEYDLGPGANLQEPGFIPRTPTSPEGDGWVLAAVNRLREGRCDLMLFDAMNIAAGPIATWAMPVRIRMTFHGSWVPAATFETHRYAMQRITG